MRRLSLLILVAALTVSAGAAPLPYELILSVEDPNFELLSGDWSLTKPSGRYNSFRWEIAGPGTGAGRARWVAEELPAGTYRIDFWVNTGDYPEDARWQVIDTTGVTDLSVDMGELAGGWHELGEFSIDRVCVVNVSDLWTLGGNTLPLDAIRFTPTSTITIPPAQGVPPHIGICIDDVGDANPLTPSEPLQTMLGLPFEMTYAVMPQQTHTSAAAEEIFARGSEVILHQPMAAISYPNPPNAIWESMTLAEVRTMVESHLDALPHVVGMNNHMGSLITQRADMMGVCVEECMERGLFLYDSRTITTSVAFDVAQEMGCFTAERDLFIDGANQTEAMALIRDLANRALHAPDVPQLAIGHERTGTAAALVAMVPELEAMGVEVWPISRCVSQIVEADRVPTGCAFSSEGSWTEDEDDALSKLLHDEYALVASTDSMHRAVFSPSIPWDGRYDVWTIWRGDASNASDITAEITHRDGITEVAVDQSASIDTWVWLGRFDFTVGGNASVALSDEGSAAGSTLHADAVRFVHAGDSEPMTTGLLVR
ncbi:divergent polysaccharide deacetylase family protein [Candidatus Sumerlaeota bacterium]|nr:divergent polysaccharide deacetylase family protein [Candidatus Sumerlaeota bacterium]